MNILYLNHNVIWRSTFHRCFLFARELVLKGNSVTILTNSRSNKWTFKKYLYEGVQIVEGPDILWGNLRSGWDPVNALKRFIYLQNQHYDIIHAFDTRPTVIIPALLYIKFIKKVPLVIDWADWWGRGGAITLRENKTLNKIFEPTETFFEEYFRKFANHTTVISNLLRKRAKSLGINNEDITLIYNGVDTRSIKLLSKDLSREKLQIESSAKVLIFSGFVLYDLDFILKLFISFHKKYKSAILLLLGNFSSNVLQKVQILINQKSVRVYKNVPRNELGIYFSAADIALLPLSDNLANQARFPMKFTDYVAAGLPIITNSVGDISKFTQMENILNVEKLNKKKYLHALMNFFRYKRKKRKTLNGIDKELDLILLSEKLQNLYRRFM